MNLYSIPKYRNPKCALLVFAYILPNPSISVREYATEFKKILYLYQLCVTKNKRMFFLFNLLFLFWIKRNIKNNTCLYLSRTNGIHFNCCQHSTYFRWQVKSPGVLSTSGDITLQDFPVTSRKYYGVLPSKPYNIC